MRQDPQWRSHRWSRRTVPSPDFLFPLFPSGVHSLIFYLSLIYYAIPESNLCLTSLHRIIRGSPQNSLRTLKPCHNHPRSETPESAAQPTFLAKMCDPHRETGKPSWKGKTTSLKINNKEPCLYVVSLHRKTERESGDKCLLWAVPWTLSWIFHAYK